MYIFVLLGRFYKHLRNVYRKLPLCHIGFVGQSGAFSCFVFLRDSMNLMLSALICTTRSWGWRYSKLQLG